MHAEKKQIISNGYTRSSDWQELAHRSRETRRKIQPLCPLCSAEIHPTDTTLRCLSCQAPVLVYQHAEVTETADTRIIYAKVSNGRSRAVVTIELKCLSCEQPLQRDETCTNTCPIQTYLVLEHDDGELYIRRAANRLDVPRDTPFIDIRNDQEVAGQRPPCAATSFPDTDTPETENSVQNSVQNSVENSASVTHPSQNAEPEKQPLTHEKSVSYRSDELNGKQRICEFLINVNAENTARTGEIRKALDLAPSTFAFLIKALIKDGKVERAAYGVYRLRT